MRRILIVLAMGLAGTLLCVGCDKEHKLSDFTFKPGLTAEQIEDSVGTPTQRHAHWVSYDLNDGTELRLFFLEGPRGGIRTLTEAAVYDKLGQRLKEVYKAPQSSPTTIPWTFPVPATSPSGIAAPASRPAF